MKLMKKWPHGLLALSVIAGIYTFLPKDEPHRTNVVNSRDGKGSAAAQSKAKGSGAPRDTAAAAGNVGDADGNSAGLPLRMVNNAPNFNHIVAAAAIINGAVDQRDAAKFVELSTTKHIAELTAQLSKLQAEIADNNLKKAETEKKLQRGDSTQGEISSGTEFVLPDEAPLGYGVADKGGVSNGGMMIPDGQTGTEKKPGEGEGTNNEQSISFARNIKLKGITGDGRVALQFGNDFALNVQQGQVVWTRYRIEQIDQQESCITYTDLRVKNSRGKACYN